MRVESPNPLFARQLQQAIGGIEGEIRAAAVAAAFVAASEDAPPSFN